MRARYAVLAIVVLGTLGALVVLRRAAIRPLPAVGDRLTVVATFYPLAEFARQVGGDRVSVTTLTPAGVEPHDFEPTPQTIASAYAADVFIRNGGGVDAWTRPLTPVLRARGVRILDMTALMGTPLPPADEDEAFDEHFWLNPVLAQRQVEAIRDAFIASDGAHADAYRTRATAYVVALATLDREYRSGLQSCGIRVVVTSHAAFGYLAREYEFTQIAITGLSPDEEPSARQLADIAETARSRGVRYIFFETLVSPQLSETLARTIGAQTLVFDPLEGLTDDAMANGETYISIMRENLTNLRTAMACR